LPQEADGTVKLFQAGLLPQSEALGKLGYSDDEITKIRAASEPVVRPVNNDAA
jgi:hypothetical protein